MDALAEIRNIYFDECDEFIGLLEGHLAALGEGRALHGGHQRRVSRRPLRSRAAPAPSAWPISSSSPISSKPASMRCAPAASPSPTTPVDTLLQAGDVLGALIAAARDGGSVESTPP